MDLKNKINDLFEYRKIPELIKLGKIQNGDRLYQSLVDLQIAIYDLDCYLESNWIIKKSKLNTFWKLIYRTMNDCGVDKKDHKKYGAHLEQYQKRELDLRENKLPLNGSMEFFYYYKSCDVRLMRQIIYDQSTSKSQPYSLADWRYFDLITEVNDDAEDIFEDLETINGNAILISFWKEGKTVCKKRILNFIQDIQSKNQIRFEKYPERYKQMYHWTNEQIKFTKKLFEKNHKSFNAELVSNSKLVQHLSL